MNYYSFGPYSVSIQPPDTVVRGTRGRLGEAGAVIKIMMEDSLSSRFLPSFHTLCGIDDNYWNMYGAYKQNYVEEVF